VLKISAILSKMTFFLIWNFFGSSFHEHDYTQSEIHLPLVLRVSPVSLLGVAS